MLSLKKDIFFIKHTFRLAKLGRFTTTPNPNVGCVIVFKDRIVGEGYHKYFGGPHAEIYALEMAGKFSKGATAYITLEPCSYYGKTPPCTDALIKSGISRVVFSILDPNPKVSGKGLDILKKSGIIVQYGIMSSQAKSINLGFLKRMKTGLPWIKLKLAVSLDGCTSLEKNKKKWITSIKSRRDVQILRAESDVILSTSQTIISDDPYLNLRWHALPKNIKNIYSEKYARQPIRVIIDSKNLVNTNYKITKCEGGPVWLIRNKEDNNKWSKSVKQIILSKYIKNNRSYINLIELMKYLGKQNVNNVLVESGINFSYSLIRMKLVDELVLYQSPKIIGNNFNNLNLLNMRNGIKLNYPLKFRILDLKKIGPDIRIILRFF